MNKLIYAIGIAVATSLAVSQEANEPTETQTPDSQTVLEETSTNVQTDTISAKLE